LLHFITAKCCTNSNEIDTTTLENYLSNQTNINQYDLINGLEPDEIDSINTSSGRWIIENKSLEK
jgi:hypothetical protein